MTLPIIDVTVKPDLDGEWELVSVKEGLAPLSLRVSIHSDDAYALLTLAAHMAQQEAYRARATGKPAGWR